jgi:hypothetical protein
MPPLAHCSARSLNPSSATLKNHRFLAIRSRRRFGMGLSLGAPALSSQSASTQATAGRHSSYCGSEADFSGTETISGNAEEPPFLRTARDMNERHMHQAQEHINRSAELNSDVVE